MALEQYDFIRSLQLLQKDYGERFDKPVFGTAYGVVEEVEDPLERGRVRVSLDGQGNQYKTDWIPVGAGFRGKQPNSLVGHRVEVTFAGGDVTRGSVTQVIDDDHNNEPVTTGIATRLSFYESGSLPPCSEENRGMLVVEGDGPYGSDWLCCCLKRRGSYLWVRHSDLAHIHKSADKGLQPSDSRGDREQPVAQYTIHDTVAPTTQAKYGEQSYNPPGDIGWYGAAE